MVIIDLKGIDWLCSFPIVYAFLFKTVVCQRFCTRQICYFILVEDETVNQQPVPKHLIFISSKVTWNDSIGNRSESEADGNTI